ncbi:murein biosynthesis integral membrane protein MurJ [Helicobacter sp. MIT 14-3879]|uniref:murein biosynthesis integral membrane protein MurJ n=1 Tax=Helicobacter sp. MIT 14-3879 TaxID=2040649 RepID=UPI000E1FA2D4|nr:murein biosynthesis integral membrane protein MurJ [Helicobacter sp. MIT 14-3879]RDU63141.1 murein biosynthesis integral membrane protein MurJ [Helicobacter sp. MIT 14-3879]
MFKKAFLTNSSGILCSRIFGFIRDLSMALVLGAGVYSDIFFVAFKFPNLFRRVFSEGAFTQSFLPSFISVKKKAQFSVAIFLIFFIFLVFFSILVCIFNGFFTKILAYGFNDETIKLAKPIVAINFWYLCLIFCVNFFSSLLQYRDNFWVSAYNTALLNITMIVALFIAKDKDTYVIVYFLSYSVLIGGILQILLHCYSLYKLKFIKLFILGFRELYLIIKYKDKLKINNIKKDIISFFAQFFPALLGSSTAQIASFIDTLLASFLISGSVSYLYYANRIFQLPLALFAIAISTALFPMVAKMINNSNEFEALKLLKNAFFILLFSLSICVVGGIALKNEIIYLLFERGKFLRKDTLEVANIFVAYLIGLLPFGLARIFSLWLYSYKKQALAAKISAISLICGVVFSLILMKPFGALGLALSSSIAGFILFILTIFYFGIKKFKIIINNKKMLILLIVILFVEYIILYFLKHFINFGGFYVHI